MNADTEVGNDGVIEEADSEEFTAAVDSFPHDEAMDLPGQAEEVLPSFSGKYFFLSSNQTYPFNL